MVTNRRSISVFRTSPHATPRIASIRPRVTGWRYAITESVSIAARLSLAEDRCLWNAARMAAYSGRVMARYPPATGSMRKERPASS